MTDLDPDLVTATLSEDERTMVEAWTSAVGLEHWSDCPPLRGIVELVVVLRVASDVPQSGTGDRIRRASEALGMADDPLRSTHPGDRFIRRLTDWQNRARESDGDFLQPRSSDTA